MTPKLPRPKKTDGYTQEVKTPCGEVYFTVNFEEGSSEPLEIFIRPGGHGMCLKAHASITGRAHSALLRTKAVNPMEIFKQLSGTNCNRTEFYEGVMHMSCYDMLGTVYLELWNLRRKEFGEDAIGNPRMNQADENEEHDGQDPFSESQVVNG